MYHNFTKESDNIGKNLTYRTVPQHSYYRTQYADDYNYMQEMQRRQEDEWHRKRQEEEAQLMKDKPKTFEYTTPYQSMFPPRDVNRFFHDSKYLEDKPPPKPDEYYFNTDVPLRLNPGTGMSTYDRAYLSPRRPNMSEQKPGVLYIIRYNQSASDDVKVSFIEQQTIIKSYGGYVLGIAGKNKIFVIEGDAGWKYCRNQSHRQQVSINYRNVDDAIAILWFPTKQTANDFFYNSFKNRFRQHNFPSSDGFECHVIPLLTPPSVELLDTFLFIEVIHARKIPAEHLQSFEAETRQDILSIIPKSLPFVAADIEEKSKLETLDLALLELYSLLVVVISVGCKTALEFDSGCQKDRKRKKKWMSVTRLEYGGTEGHVSLKDGSLFGAKSKIFVSTFHSMSELSHVWDEGVIQRNLMKWNISGLNVFACSLHDWNDQS